MCPAQMGLRAPFSCLFCPCGFVFSYIGGLELEYARPADCILGLLGTQSEPTWPLQLLSVEYNKQLCVACQGWAGGSIRRASCQGGSGRVVHAAGQTAKRNPAPPFFRRKDKGYLGLAGHEGISRVAHVAEAVRGTTEKRREPEPFVWWTCCWCHPSRAPGLDAARMRLQTQRVAGLHVGYNK